MAGDSDAVPGDALEDIAYLAKSANRVRLLEALAAGSYARRDLDEQTGIPRTTIGRIVNEFEERGWVERTTDGTYTATATGELVVAEFTPLVESMDTIRRLGDAAEWLPIDELSIDIRHFGDATVKRSGPNVPFEFVESLADRIRDAARLRVLTFLAPPSPVGEAMHTGVVEGRLTAEHVLAGGLVEYLRDHVHHPPDWEKYIDAGAHVYCYDGYIPCNLFIVDETVLIASDQPEGTGAAIETENEPVQVAANGLFETYMDDADRVTSGLFS